MNFLNQPAPAELAPPPAVAADRLGKKYAKSLGQSLRYGLADIGRELMLQKEAPPRLRPGEFWALENVSFDLKPGEALALIGRNGSGKSTLLKMLCGLAKPDAGTLTIRGRMATLIELGAGFDPILSGRENVYINASILGLPREAVHDLLPAIIEFSGLRDFMETPVKYYSSGMRARLAYSIATKLAPDIFLVDEVLAVGDSDFRLKCLRNMAQFVDQGGSLVFVSHSAQQIQMICNRGLVIDSGKVLCQGTALEALDFYHRHEPSLPPAAAETFIPPEKPPCSIASVHIEPTGPSGTIRTGEPVAITLTAEVREEINLTASLAIMARDLMTIVAIEQSALQRCAPGRHAFRFLIPHLPLMPGLFHLRAGLNEGEREIPIADFGVHSAPASFAVTGDPSPSHVRAQALGQLVRIGGSWQ